MKYKKFSKCSTPVGEVSFCALRNPSTEYNDDGQYVVAVKFSKDNKDFDVFRHDMDDMLNEAKALAAEDLQPGRQQSLVLAYPWRHPRDESGFDIEGEWQISAKQNVKVTSSRTGTTFFPKVVVFDAAGNKMEEIPDIGRGSKVQLGVLPRNYYVASENKAGLSLQLEAVMLHELVESEGYEVNDYGFTPSKEKGAASSDSDDDIAW